MRSRQNFIKILVIVFAIFAILKSPQKLKFKEQAAPKYEFIEEIKNTLDFITTDHRPNISSNKNSPLLKAEQDQQIKDTKQGNLPPNNTSITRAPKDALKRSIGLPVSVSSNPDIANIPPPEIKNDPISKNEIAKTWVEDKIMVITDNLLHTEQGRNLLEKFLNNNAPETTPLIKEQKSKELYRNNSVIDINIGKGAIVECGDTVSVNYTTRLVNGQVIENNNDNKQPFIFQVGDKKVIKGLEYAVLGMKENGQRRLVIPPQMGYSKMSSHAFAGNEFVTLDVELINVISNSSYLDDKIRIFSNTEDNKNSPLYCSEPVYFNYTLSTGQNKILYKSKDPASFVLGSNNVPPAINKAFSNIKKNSKRTAIIPTNLLRNKKISFLPPDIKIPDQEFVILDIETTN
ncbi:MAG: FKBP-type peptidyl-prolyl cis-trans isomerase [Rickettsiales bacterium]